MKMLLLAKETAGAILSDAGLTILTGVVVVFFMLLLLVCVIKVFGAIMSRFEKSEKTVAAPAAPAVATAPAPAAAVGNTEPVSTKPEIQNGIPDETVAAISGAIACMAPAGKQYAVRSIMKK